jgi:hypothetical protein
MSTTTPLQQAVQKVDDALGDIYTIYYSNNMLHIVIKDGDNRKQKNVELLKKINDLQLPTKINYIEVLYKNEVETGKTYQTEIIEDLNKSFGNVATVSSVQKSVVVDVKGVNGKILTDVAKSFTKHIFREVITKYPLRKAELTFSIRYIPGRFQFTIKADNTIAIESLYEMSYTDLVIISELSNKPFDSFHTIGYAGLDKDEFIFALESLQDREIVETLDFNPDTVVDGFGGAPNYPDSFQVKLLQTEFSKYL